jgi:hypothetical protein
MSKRQLAQASQAGVLRALLAEIRIYPYERQGKAPYVKRSITLLTFEA